MTWPVVPTWCSVCKVASQMIVVNRRIGHVAVIDPVGALVLDRRDEFRDLADAAWQLSSALGGDPDAITTALHEFERDLDLHTRAGTGRRGGLQPRARSGRRSCAANRHRPGWSTPSAPASPCAAGMPASLRPSRGCSGASPRADRPSTASTCGTTMARRRSPTTEWCRRGRATRRSPSAPSWRRSPLWPPTVAALAPGSTPRASCTTALRSCSPARRTRARAPRSSS